MTGHAVGIVLDPAVVRFDQLTGMARLVGPGGTVIRFQMGDLKTDVTLEAAAAANPEKITIEPRSVELAPGSTARLKLIGHYKDGTTADLTAAAEWKPQNDKIVFAMGGFLEGLAPGAATISARYRATPESPYLDASANVNVAKIDLKSLEIGVEPVPVAVGRGSRLRIDAVGRGRQALLGPGVVATEDRGRPVLPGLGPRVEPAGRPGRPRHALGHLRRRTDGRASTSRVAVDPRRRSARGPSRQTRSPSAALVGEIADLSIVSPSSTPVRISSSKPGIVEVTAEQPAHRPRQGHGRGRGRPGQPKPHRRSQRRQGRVPVDRH